MAHRLGVWDQDYLVVRVLGLSLSKSVHLWASICQLQIKKSDKLISKDSFIFKDHVCIGVWFLFACFVLLLLTFFTSLQVVSGALNFIVL